MPVTSLVTSVENFNGAPTFISNNARYGGGQGATVNTDIIREGTQSGGRRTDNTTGGLGVQISPAIDLSGADEHIKVWFWVTQWAQLTALGIVIASGSGGSVGDIHEVPASEWPPGGGFIPVWIDVSRTPEQGGSANEASINEIGTQITIGDVGGNAQNCILDEIHRGTSGLRWTGTGPGDFQDFRDFEDTNNIGVFLTNNGIDLCYARLEIGDTGGTETDFTDSNFTLVFPDQALVGASFMGITTEMQNASSVVNLSNGTIQSSNPTSATRRPDFVVNGTSGSMDLTSLNMLGMRFVKFTSAVTYDGGTIELLDLEQGGSTLQNCTIRANTASGVAVCDDITDTALDNVNWVQVGSGHAIEITSTGTYTFTSQFFDGFGADGTNSAAVYNNSGGAVTINIVGGGDTPTVRNGTGSSTTINNAVSITLNDLVPGSTIRIFNVTDSVEISKLIEPTDTFTTSVNFTGDKTLDIRVRNHSSAPFYQPFNATGTLTSTGFNLNVNQILDE